MAYVIHVEMPRLQTVINILKTVGILLMSIMCMLRWKDNSWSSVQVNQHGLGTYHRIGV